MIFKVIELLLVSACGATIVYGLGNAILQAIRRGRKP